jgi:hypothetical protein
MNSLSNEALDRKFVFKSPYLSRFSLTLFFLIIVLIYRVLGLLIVTQELHGINLLTTDQLNFTFDLLTILFIAVILFYQRTLNGYLYFGLLGILTIAMINVFSSHPEIFNPIKTLLQLITIFGTILFFYFLVKIQKTKEPDNINSLTTKIFILYSITLFLRGIDQFILFSGDLSNLIGIVNILCIFGLGTILIYYLVVSYQNKLIPIITIAIGTILGLGFSIAFGRDDLRRLIARSIFSESTSFELTSVFNITVFEIALNEIIDFIFLITTAIIFSSFILLIIINFVQKKRNPEYLALLVILGLTGVDVVVPLLLFLRLFSIPNLLFEKLETSSF